jgi:hypothetical protein
MKPFARYAYTQQDGDIRFYNVYGDHPLKGSTVSVKTLVRENIPIPDMTPQQIDEEIKKVDKYLNMD